MHTHSLETMGLGFSDVGEALARLRRELARRLSDAHRQFLSGLTRAQPDWSLLQYPHAEQLPALRWKLANLNTFQKRRPQDFIAQADALDAGLAASLSKD